jgi:hypothetical protein
MVVSVSDAKQHLGEPDEWVELLVEIMAQTDRAICVLDGRAVWLPRSQIRPPDVESGPAEIEVRYWLALQEGLI